MRITGGNMRGRRLYIPRDITIRPTPDIVREALFDTLPSVSGITFLDLFAGSGIVGIEAMSRGAASATFVEKDKRMAEVIRENLQKSGLELQCDVLAMSAERGIHLIESSSRSYEIIFCDPPYEKGWINRILLMLSVSSVVADEGAVVLQHSVREAMTYTVNFVLADQRIFGDTTITILKREKL